MFAFLFAFGLVALGLLIGKCIRAGRAGGYPVYEIQTVESDVQRELDDWLAGEELPFDFKVEKYPEARARIGRRAA